MPKFDRKVVANEEERDKDLRRIKLERRHGEQELEDIFRKIHLPF